MGYVISPDAVCATLEDGAVVLHLRTKRYYSMNETGALVWRQLAERAAPKEIVGALVAAYDVARPEAEASVGQLIEELIAEDLIVVVDDQ